MTVYSSPYSAIEAEPHKSLLSVTWFKESINLDEEGVKAEISKILDYIKEHSTSCIIVDTRNYPFRENNNIQNWINHTYMPQIIDSGVLRYAIIVLKEIPSQFENFQDPDDPDDDGLIVEYFTDPEQARRWVAS